jgi:uncharacterized glyoxalase superfamily protein PhnB
MPASYVPTGYGRVSPYLITKDAPSVIQLLTEALGGEEVDRHLGPDGRIMHAEVRIGDSVVMLADASDEFPAMPCMVHVYVPDCDAAYRRALGCGATSVREPADQFYGDRSGGVRDAGGNQWWIATHVEDVAPDEMQRRAAAAGKG